MHRAGLQGTKDAKAGALATDNRLMKSVASTKTGERTALRLGATGFALIAICYGFARFAFGLFLPQIDADLSLGASLSGVIAGGSFLAFCIAIAFAAHLTERLGARAVAIMAALIAAIAMLGIATAPSALWLAGAVMLAGSSTGLASPPMAAAITAAVSPERQDFTNTIVNSGTSGGVVLSGPIALAMGSQWRLGFTMFAVMALVMAAIAVFSMSGVPATARKSGGLPRFTGSLARLAFACFVAGVSSTALWSFGTKLATLRLGWDSSDTGLLWVAIGGGGIAGAWAGSAVGRFGLDRVHWASLGAMIIGILAVGTSIATSASTLAGGALFGAAYITLTGAYLIWGIRALPDRPAAGVSIAFLSLAVGQTVGAALFGVMMDGLGAGYAVAAFAAVAALAGMARAQRAE